MEMLIGIVIGIVFASSYFVVYNLGKKRNNLQKMEEISEIEKAKMRRLQEGFNNVMNYDINVALGKGERELLNEWKKYEAGKKYNGRLDPPYYDTVNLNLDFFNGNQWKNLKSNGMPTPVFNILKRGVQFFVASLMSNRVKVNFSPLEYRDDGIEGLDVFNILKP